ncbi:MAG: nucleotidyltransferase family protein [Bacteroidota bacterium]
MKEVIILAGGLGTRLKEVINDIPKPMAQVCDKPFLDYIFKYLKSYGVTDVVLSVGYKYEVIEAYFGSEFCGINVKYAIENEPLGTGGAISLALQSTQTNNVLVINGDTFFDVDINSLFDFYLKNNADLAIALRSVEDVSRYGAVLINENGVMTDYLEKNDSLGAGQINGGMYVLNKKEFLKHQFETKFSFEKEFLEKDYKSGKIAGLNFKAYFIDIGIPTDYYRAQTEFLEFKY